MNDERGESEPGGTDALEAQRRRAARERIRLETEIDRLTTLLAERSDQLRRARADADRLRRHPVLRAYTAAVKRLGPARPLLRRLRGSAATPETGSTETKPSEPPGAGSEPPAPLDPARRAEVARRIAADEGPVDPAVIASLDVEVVVIGGDGRGASGTVGELILAAAHASAAEWLLVQSRTANPAESGWLARLVDGAMALGADAATPRAVEALPDGSIRLADRGRSFDPGPGMPIPAGLGRGDEAFGAAARGRRLVVAPGDAAVLIRRTTLAGLGAIPGRDLSEWAIELGIRLALAGRGVAYVGDAVVWTAATTDPESRSWAELHDRWAGRLHRQVWRSARTGGPWSTRPLSVGLLHGAGAEPSASERVRTLLGTAGFDVRVDPPASGDIVVALDPDAGLGSVDRVPVRVAVAGDRRADWLERGGLDEIDIVIRDPDAIVAALDHWIGQVRWAIHIGPLDWPAAATWGDTAFGRAIRHELERRDVSAALLVHAERDDPVALRADVALHIVGTRRLPIRAGQLNLLWIISHPDAVRASICSRYDLVFVASSLFADHLAAQIDVPVVALHQATDPERFFPEPTGPAHELLFVGNSRNRHRPVIDALAGTPHDLAIYGTNWRPDLVDPARVRGAWIPNDDVHRAYGAAAIVLNDHWPDMRDEGFLSNRLYDVLASGGFVLSDEVPGIEAEFDGGVATWSEPADLLASVDRYLGDPETRRTMAARGRAAVLARHTMGHRVDALLAEAGRFLERRPMSIEPAVSGDAT